LSPKGERKCGKVGRFFSFLSGIWGREMSLTWKQDLKINPKMQAFLFGEPSTQELPRPSANLSEGEIMAAIEKTAPSSPVGAELPKGELSDSEQEKMNGLVPWNEGARWPSEGERKDHQDQIPAGCR